MKTLPSFELVVSGFQVMRSVDVWRTNGAFAVTEIGHSKLREDWLVELPNTSHAALLTQLEVPVRAKRTTRSATLLGCPRR